MNWINVKDKHFVDLNQDGTWVENNNCPSGPFLTGYYTEGPSGKRTFSWGQVVLTEDGLEDFSDNTAYPPSYVEYWALIPEPAEVEPPEAEGIFSYYYRTMYILQTASILTGEQIEAIRIMLWHLCLDTSNVEGQLQKVAVLISEELFADAVWYLTQREVITCSYWGYSETMMRDRPWSMERKRKSDNHHRETGFYLSFDGEEVTECPYSAKIRPGIELSKIV